MFVSAENALDRTYFNLNSLFDVAQIGNFERSYRELDEYINNLLPYVSRQSEEFHVPRMIRLLGLCKVG